MSVPQNYHFVFESAEGSDELEKEKKEGRVLNFGTDSPDEAIPFRIDKMGGPDWFGADPDSKEIEQTVEDSIWGYFVKNEGRLFLVIRGKCIELFEEE